MICRLVITGIRFGTSVLVTGQAVEIRTEEGKMQWFASWPAILVEKEIFLPVKAGKCLTSGKGFPVGALRLAQVMRSYQPSTLLSAVCRFSGTARAWCSSLFPVQLGRDTQLGHVLPCPTAVSFAASRFLEGSSGPLSRFGHVARMRCSWLAGPPVLVGSHCSCIEG